MPAWIKKPAEDGKEGDEGQERVIELKPEMIRDAIKEDLDNIKSSSKAMVDFINEQKADRQRAQEAEAEKQRRENEKVDDIDFITNPEEAMNRKLKPIAESNAVMASMFVRREVLEGLEYYNEPEFKKRVDAMIDQQPLQNRLDRSVIMNAYKVNRFDFDKEVADGKIKLSLSGGGGNRKGNDRDNGRSDDDTETMSAEEKQYARKLGISEKDWISQKKEMEYV